MNEENYKISLTGNGLSVSKEIPEEVARRVLNLLLGGSMISSGPARVVELRESPIRERPTSPDYSVRKPSISLREYLDEVQAKRNPDIILGIASHIVNHIGEESFGADDIRKFFSIAGEKMPANFGRDFRWVALNGWIAENHSTPGRYYITKRGQQALNEKFPKELSKPQPGYTRRK